MAVWLIFAVTCILILLWIVCLRHALPFSHKDILKSHPVLIIAHPDDEVMFFMPLLLALRPNISVLCLSAGNHDGLGDQRISEFYNVMKRLGITDFEISDSFPDGWKQWPSEAVARHVGAYLARHPQVDSIFTFDADGISGHPNHISINRCLSDLSRFKPKNRDFLVFELRTVGIFRKYLLPPLEVFFSGLESDSGRLILANLQEPLAVFRHMKLYTSQNVWFRQLYAVFSRYAYINSFNVKVL